MAKVKKKIRLTEFIYLFLSKKRGSKEYKRHYRTLARHIENFERKTGLKVRTDNLNEQMCEEFLNYLRTEGRMKGKAKGRGLMVNSIRNLWHKLCHMMNRAAKLGHAVDFSFGDIMVVAEDANAVYLTIDELKQINQLKGLSKEAKAVRDRFLVGCFTALRYGNYSTLSKDDIINGKIYVKTNKTGRPVVIPVHQVIVEILTRNNGDFPPTPSPQAFGATIKRVCKKAGVNAEIMYERTIGTKVVKKRMKKYELVSTHTARRTGATNMYLAGIPAARIMLLTGHKTEQSFFRYIRIEREENAITLSKHAFFN